MNTVYANEAYALVLTEAGSERTYTVHERLPFNQLGDAIAEPGKTPREAADNADRELARLALKARIQAQTAEYLATGKVGNEFEVEVAPPKGWDSAEA